MVHIDVWLEAVEENYPGLYLCIHCLEKLLGRKLVPHDFTNAPVNDLLFGGHGTTRPMFNHSEVLMNRLGAPRPWDERMYF